MLKYTDLLVPALTPLTERITPDLPAFRRHLKDLYRRGVRGFFVLGTAGLGPFLTLRDWREVAETAREALPDDTFLVLGIIETSTSRALERISLLKADTADAFALTSPFFLPPKTTEEFETHFRICRKEAGDVPMIAYNLPSAIGVNIPLDTLENLARDGLLAGVKDSSGDTTRFTQTCERLRPMSIPVWEGNRPNLKHLKTAGAAGMVSVPANLAPEAFLSGWRAVKTGDDLTRHQREIDRAWEAIVGPANDWIGGATWALGQRGLGVGRSLQTISPPPVERQDEILKYLNPPA